MIRALQRIVLASLVAVGSAIGRFTARYEGATFSSSRSYIPAATQSARFDACSAARIELVRKSRYFERNCALLNRAVDIFECYVAGPEYQISPASSDLEWNSRAAEWWAGWCRYPDLTSRQTFGTLFSLAVRTWVVDGEAFILLTRDMSGRPRIQLFEGHLVNTPPHSARSRATRSSTAWLSIGTAGQPAITSPRKTRAARRATGQRPRPIM